MTRRHLAVFAIVLASFTIAAPAATKGDHVLLKNDSVMRELSFDGQVWRTTRFARGDGSDELPVASDELHILNLDDSEVTLDDYSVQGEAAMEKTGDVQTCTIHYGPRVGAKLPPVAPRQIVVSYTLSGEPYLRKTVTLLMQQGQAIDRLDVERFSVQQPAARGGRGEPVFVNNEWFFGVEYPAAYTRHTDGNTPKADSAPYDLFGNYSGIRLESHDVDRHPRAGLIRLMHFPGLAKAQPDGDWTIVSKTAVAGVGRKGATIELAFEDYLATIRRPVRSFIHYNNWFDAEGKKLTPENLVDRIFLPFKQHLDPFGVHVDAIVADDGWQDKRSIYAPNPQQFPHGMDDIAALADALQKAGGGMGLWIALNGYNSDVDWGVAHGYPEAVRNDRFNRFKRYYSITDPHYDQTIRQRITELVQRCHIQYFKHDFNEMCDLSDHGHLPDDRHGHEASVDQAISLLSLERQLNPQIYQNITNWIWFSPWWLQQGNNLWMLSNDSGDFLGYPEISQLVRASVYRDVNLYQVWHDPETRPLVPISHLMTHGIIYTKSKYAGGGDTLRDFGDYVMMYYMRGTQLKEWYINPGILSDEQWKVLGRATRWSEEHLQTLAHSVYVGGDPRLGQPYGYVCWNGEKGILSVRNPSPVEAQITVPFDQAVWYRGGGGRDFHADVVYPFQGPLGVGLVSGRPMQLKIPAYTVMVMHLSPEKVEESPVAPAPVMVQSDQPDGVPHCRITLPSESVQRCDLLVTAQYQPSKKAVTFDGPEISIDGKPAHPTRIARGLSWVMLCFDLRDLAGKMVDVSVATSRAANQPDSITGIEGCIVLDRPVRSTAASDDPRLPEPLDQGFARQSAPVFKK